MTRPVITLKNIAVRFQTGHRMRKRGFEALHDVSLQLNHGEKLGIIGRNGAGKSTLLRVLAGVLSPDAGTIIRSHGTCQLLSLGAGFMSNLTGRENAVLSGLIMGMGRKQVVSRLEAIKSFSELGDFFDEPLRTYSSGMRSRLGFAVAIQQQPDILLIDETLSVGDASFRSKSMAALNDRFSSDATIVLVSHDDRTIEQVCDRVLWLEDGASKSDGSTSRILSDYAAATSLR